MCKFFSFTTRGYAEYMFFNAQERAAIDQAESSQYEQDSHSSIADRFITDEELSIVFKKTGKLLGKCDIVNKYELIPENAADLLNTHWRLEVDTLCPLIRNDELEVIKKKDEFIASPEFQAIIQQRMAARSVEEQKRLEGQAKRVIKMNKERDAYKAKQAKLEALIKKTGKFNKTNIKKNLPKNLRKYL
jgi:hypothetical protein